MNDFITLISVKNVDKPESDWQPVEAMLHPVDDDVMDLRIAHWMGMRPMVWEMLISKVPLLPAPEQAVDDIGIEAQRQWNEHYDRQEAADAAQS